MKLTGTNSSIGLIVLIAYAHQRSFAAMMMLLFCPDARKCAPDGPRHKVRRANALYGCPMETSLERSVVRRYRTIVRRRLRGAPSAAQRPKGRDSVKTQQTNNVFK